MGWTEIIQETLSEMSGILERLSWRLVEGTLAIVMSLFAWAALSWPGPVPSFYRVAMATMILVATGIVEYFIIRMSRFELQRSPARLDER